MTFLINLAIKIIRYATETGKITDNQIDEISNIVNPNINNSNITDKIINKMTELLYDNILIEGSDKSLDELQHMIYQELADIDPVFTYISYDLFLDIFNPLISEVYDILHKY